MQSKRSFRLIPDTGLSWVPYAWLIYLPNVFVAPALRHAPALEWVATAVGSLVFLASYFAGYWLQGKRLAGAIAIQVLLGVAFSPFNPGAATFFIYASSFSARLEPKRSGARGIAIITVVAAATGLASAAPIYFWILGVVFAPLIGAVNWQYAETGRADAKLRLAQEEIARLAAIAERERIARDLHDVVGHTLTLIVLKAELASKLADRDAPRAMSEIRDVERISRGALSDVRAAIAGYRASWDDELARARVMLATAGVRGEFVGAPASPMPRDAEETLALAVREAVTNVVRHARASTCVVRWDQTPDACRLEVIDDGRGGVVAEGHGLTGLRARVEALGGSVVLQSARGMRVAVVLPAGCA